MRQIGNLNVLVIVSILFLIKNTSGLRCWRCSSDATNSKFCGDTLDLSEISEQQKRWNYVECDKKPPQHTGNDENLIPKCRILLQHVNDIPTYTRSCFWEEEHVPSDSCADQKYNPSYVKTVSCYTCTEDGCNDKLVRPPAETAVEITTKSPASSSVMAVLSRIVFAIFMLSVIIVY